MVLWMRLVKDS